VSDLAPDRTIIRAHLDKLFGRCATEYPGGLCEIAWTEAGKFAIANAQSFPTTPEGLAEATALSVSLNAAGSNVYVGVNPRKPGSPERGRCSAEHVEIAFFQFCECDKPESLDLLRRSPLPYAMFVITGRIPNARVHGYHELITAIRNMPRWRQRQEAERDFCRGDNVVDPPRVMRLAGTVNYPAPHKVSRGYKAELVELHCTQAKPISDVDFDFGGFNGAAEEPLTNGEDKSERAERPNFDDKIAACFAGIDADDHWHDNCRNLIAKLVSEGYDRRVILGLAPRLTRPGYMINETIREIEEFIRGAEEKYRNSSDENTDEDDWERPPPPPWTDTPISDWAERKIPPRTWVMEHWIPTGQCVGLYGIPGIRKTDLLLQLLMASSLGLAFCGIPLTQVKTYGLFCEDTDEEIARRAARIAGFYGRSLAEFTGFLYASLVGSFDTEFVIFDQSGKMTVRSPY